MNDAGFLIENDVFSAEECDDIIASLPPTNHRRAGARHLMTNSEVSDLSLDPRLLRIAQRALAKPIPFSATLFEKSGRANWLVAWHQDTALPLAEYNSSPEWGPWSKKAGILYALAPAWALRRIVALRLHLDASTSENGSLRVVSGSHTTGVLSGAKISRVVQSQEATECFVSRGGILAMSPLLLHSSSKARLDGSRRVLHIMYADALNLAEGVRLAVA